MKIKIVENKEKPFLYRKEMKLEVEFDKEVPSRGFLREHVAKAAKSEKEMVIIDKIDPNYGIRVANVVAHVYNDKKKMDSFVREHMKKRHEPKESKEAKPAEEKKEEPVAPKEEKKEAPKEEKKDEPKEESAPKEEKKDEPEAQKEEKKDE